MGSLAIHVKVSYWGSIKSPFYELSERSKEAQMVYLTPKRDEYSKVAAGGRVFKKNRLFRLDIVKSS